MSRRHAVNTARSEVLDKEAKRIEEERALELSDIKEVMQTEAGRRLFFRIINKICHYDESSAVNSGSFTYMREGEREVGRILKGDVFEAAFKEHQQMELEWKEELDNRKRRLGVTDPTSTVTELEEE